jgi:uncharacterized protein (TIGR03437 family)
MQLSKAFAIFIAVSSSFGQEPLSIPRLDHSVTWNEQSWDTAVSHERLFGPMRREAKGPETLIFDKSRMLSPRSAGEPGLEPRQATPLTGLPIQTIGFQAQADDNSTLGAGPSGAASADHLVSISDQAIRIQDRNGVELSSVTLERFFASQGPFRGSVLARQVLFDPISKRWVVTASSDNLLNSAAVLIAFSLTSDPRGNWRFTKLNASIPNAAFSNLKMGVTAKMLVISVDQLDLLFYDSTRNFVFGMQELIAGPAVPSVFEDFLEANAPASDPGSDGSRMMLVNNSFNLNNGNYALALKEIRLTGNTAASLTVGARYGVDAGDIGRYSGGSILPQLGGDAKIDAFDSGIVNCATRGPGVWCVNTMFVRFGTEFRSVIQYTRLNWGVTGNATLAERVRIDDSTGVTYYGYPSIAVNRNNDVMISYNRFRADRPVTAMFAYRRGTDVAGGLSFDNIAKEGEDYYLKGAIGSVIWGPSSSTTTDPADDTAFWSLTQYPMTRTAAGTSLWGLWWTRLSPRNGSCTFRLEGASSADVPVVGGLFRATVVATPSDCTYLVAPNAGWIRRTTTAPPASGTAIEFRAAENRLGSARTATITLGNQTFTVRQPANPNPPVAEPVLNVTRFIAPLFVRAGEAATLSATVRNVGFNPATSFRVSFFIGTGTAITSRDTRLAFNCSYANGLAVDREVTCTGSTTIPATTAPGLYRIGVIADDQELVQTTDRRGNIRLSDNGTLTVTATASAPSMTMAGVVNAATAAAGPVAPGTFLVIYGERLGPATLTTLTLDARGVVNTTLAGTRVLFDGVPAPIVYTSAGQASVIVPYAVAGRTSTIVAPEFNGVRGNAISIPVAATAPGFFTVDFSGRNQVAVLNEDGSVNSAANPSEAGRILVFYGTGAGAFRTAATDGAVIGAPVPEFAAPLTIEIGGLPAEVLYAGPAPGLVSGVFQINARVPAGVTPGNAVPVRVTSGTVVSPAGTTLAVR